MILILLKAIDRKFKRKVRFTSCSSTTLTKVNIFRLKNNDSYTYCIVEPADGLNKRSILSFYYSVFRLVLLTSKQNRSSNRKGCWWWLLMERIHYNLMKLGWSLGNVPQKMKKIVIKTRYISDFSYIFKSKIYTENGLTVQNISNFYNKFFYFFWNVT
jgi:hypothetical protein